MTYQPYNRLYKLIGTSGYATKYPEERFALDGGAIKHSGVPQVDKLDTHNFMSKEQQDDNVIVQPSTNEPRPTPRKQVERKPERVQNNAPIDNSRPVFKIQILVSKRTQG